MMIDKHTHSDSEQENFEEDNLTQILIEKSSFIDNLANTKNGKAKTTLIITEKTQNNYLSLLESLINNLNNNVEEEIDIKSLDATQVWALIDNFSKDNSQFKLFNSNNNENVSKSVIDELKVAKKSLRFLNKKKEREEEEVDQNENLEEDLNVEEEDLNEDENLNQEDDLQEENKPEKRVRKHKDMFFDLTEMNKFADELENENFETDEKNRPDDEEELLENDDEMVDDKSVHSDKDFKYEDFFDAPETKSRRTLIADENEQDIDDAYMEDDIFDIENKIIKNKKEEVDNKYEFLTGDKNQIEEIEQKMMANKEWHMKGEVTSKERPKGSLLENFLDFDATVKPPPIPTGEYTDSIEKLIKMRIKDDLFDDPVRKTVEIKNKTDFELNFQKDKKGLGDIYEEEYEKNVMKLSSENEISAAKKEINDLCAKVYTIFDKLTNNNFISGLRHNEMKVITNVPSIQLEEISNYVTDNKSNTKSATELFSARDAEFKTRDEFTTDDRKTAHKNWKRNVRNRLRENETNKKMKNLMKSVDSKFEAKMIMKQEKNKQIMKNSKNSELKSSKFFGNLQKIASDDIVKKKRRDAGINMDESLGNENKVAKKYKL